MKLIQLAVPFAACLALAACAKSQGSAAADGKVVHVYNWSDYIAESTNPDFEKATGIKVTYDVFDQNEILETKMLAGGSGYDVVVPSSQFLGRQERAGAFLALDKSKIPNYKNLDPALMQRLRGVDPGNKYGIPYTRGTVGIGYNVDAVKKVFGNTGIANSLDIVFKPENAAKLKECGISVLDAPSEIIPVALNYLHENPNSTNPQVIAKAGALLKKIRPYVRTFHSSAYIDGLAGGDLCLAVGWSGDVFQARSRADEAGNGVHVAYAIPREGSALWFDMLAIPKDAKHVDNAYAYINYLLDPKVAAANANAIGYPNAVPASRPMIDAKIANDPSLYPPPSLDAKLFTFAIVPADVDRQYQMIWSDVKAGK